MIQRAIRQVTITKIWRYIKRVGLRTAARQGWYLVKSLVKPVKEIQGLRICVSHEFSQTIRTALFEGRYEIDERRMLSLMALPVHLSILFSNQSIAYHRSLAS